MKKIYNQQLVKYRQMLILKNKKRYKYIPKYKTKVQWKHKLT